MAKDTRTFLQRVDDYKRAQAEQQAADTPVTPPTPITKNLGDTTAYTMAAHRSELEQLSRQPNGGRNHALNITALKLARLPIDRTTLRADLIQACHSNGLIRDDGLRSAEQTINSAFSKADLDGPRDIPERPNIDGRVTEVSPDAIAAANGSPVAGREIRWTRAADTQDAIPVWAWTYEGRGRIQVGTLALFAGRPGAGKSSAARWLAAQATLGRLEGQWDGHPQHVAYIAGEESARYTITPGLRAAGADLTRIHYPAVFRDGEPSQLLSTLDENALITYLLDRGITIVIVDPLMSTITANADINKNNETRAQVQPWARIADAINGIVIGVAHLRKNNTGDVVAAVTGSSAFGEIARSVFGFAKNPDTDDRVMSQHKNSTGVENLSLAYLIESRSVTVATGETTDVGAFRITGPSEVTVEDILSDGGMNQSAGTGAECQRWLKDYISVEGPVRSRNVKQEAQKEGYPARTVERAAKKIGVIAESRDFPRSTYWSLPNPVTPTDPSQSRQQSRHE